MKIADARVDIHVYRGHPWLLVLLENDLCRFLISKLHGEWEKEYAFELQNISLPSSYWFPDRTYSHHHFRSSLLLWLFLRSYAFSVWSPKQFLYCERKIHLIPLLTPRISLSSLAISTTWQVYTRSSDPWKGQGMKKMCCYSSIWEQPASSGKWKADSLSLKLDSHAIFCPVPLASRKFSGFGSGISHPNTDSPFQNRRKKGDPNTYYLKESADI